MAGALALGHTEMFRLHPRADLHTPRSTFDTFCRAILTEQPSVLWETLHPDLRSSMQRRLSIEGAARFFSRMKPIISSDFGRLRLGEPKEVDSSAVVCGLYRQGTDPVGHAWFSFGSRQWTLTHMS